MDEGEDQPHDRHTNATDTQRNRTHEHKDSLPGHPDTAGKSTNEAPGSVARHPCEKNEDPRVDAEREGLPSHDEEQGMDGDKKPPDKRP